MSTANYSTGTGQILWDGRLKYECLLKKSVHFFAGGDIMQLIYDFLTEYLLIYCMKGILFINLPNNSVFSQLYWYSWWKQKEFYWTVQKCNYLLRIIGQHLEDTAIVFAPPPNIEYSLHHPIDIFENSVTLEMPLPHPVDTFVPEIWKWIQKIDSEYSLVELLKLADNELPKTKAFIEFLKEKCVAKKSIEKETIKVWGTKNLFKDL